jgi:hypothetical protein
MTKWFFRHLNWSIVLFTIFTNILCWYLVKFFLFVTKIPWWGPAFSPDTVDVLLPSFSSFAYDFHFILADVLLLVVFYWILSKKNRNKLVLLFFVIFLPIDIPILYSYIHIFDVPATLYIIRLFSILLWVIGWIILLTLKNKPITVTNEIDDEQ